MRDVSTIHLSTNGLTLRFRSPLIHSLTPPSSVLTSAELALTEKLWGPGVGDCKQQKANALQQKLQMCDRIVNPDSKREPERYPQDILASFRRTAHNSVRLFSLVIDAQ
jgi:hypothetical protein